MKSQASFVRLSRAARVFLKLLTKNQEDNMSSVFMLRLFVF